MKRFLCQLVLMAKTTMETEKRAKCFQLFTQQFSWNNLFDLQRFVHAIIAINYALN